jgi:hypothetical protein
LQDVNIQKPVEFTSEVFDSLRGQFLHCKLVLGSRETAWHSQFVSTVAEIESAIERLPEPEVAQLAEWLADFRRRSGTTSAGEHRDLDGLIGTWCEDPAFDAAVRAFEQVDEAMWK